MNCNIERDWITEARFRAVVLMTSFGHRCGYVAVPTTHPLYWADYNEAHPALTFPADEPVGKRGIIPLLCGNGSARPDSVFDVHGGLTYSGGSGTYPVEATDLWWFGYDCGHAGDNRDLEIVAAMYPDKPDMVALLTGEGVVRSLDYCIAECESLAEQLISRVNFKETSE